MYLWACLSLALLVTLVSSRAHAGDDAELIRQAVTAPAPPNCESLAEDAPSCRVACADLATKLREGAVTHPLRVEGACPSQVDLRGLAIKGPLFFESVSGKPDLLLRGANIAGDLVVRGSAFGALDVQEARVHSLYVLGPPATEGQGLTYVDDCTPEVRGGDPAARQQATSILARGLRSDAVRVHLMSLSEIALDDARVDGPIGISGTRAAVVSLQAARATTVELTRSHVSQRFDLSELTATGSTVISCAKVDAVLALYLARIDGLTQLQHVTFTPGTSVVAFHAQLGVLELESVDGQGVTMNLEGASAGMLSLQGDSTLSFADVSARAFDFARIRAELQASTPTAFFDAAARDDDALYRRLAAIYAADGQFDAADEALRRHSWWLGVLRMPWVLAVALLLTIAAGVAFLRRALAEQLPVLDAFALSIDLLLPDLVALGFRETYQPKLATASRATSHAIFLYRLLGWGLVSAALAALALRVSY